MRAAPKVLLLGASGQLGTALRASFADYDVFAPDRAAADFLEPESLREVVRAARPHLILNAAAYTAVDRAESEREAAELVNHHAVRVLGEEAERAGAIVVHYSTDYVFDGAKADPWTETDAASPLNVYGASKLAGERALAAACSRHIILRTSWVYAATGSNFLRTMLRLGREREVLRVVDDQYGAPTSAAALASATRTVTDRVMGERPSDQWPGVYHASCGSRTSWCGFAQAILARAAVQDGQPVARVEAITSAEYPTAARRPRNSVLSNEELFRTFGVCLPSWEQALDAVFEELP